MENLIPFKNTFTIYSKTDCRNCKYVKMLLEDNEFKYIEVNCDNFLQENRDEFLKHMTELTGKEQIIFPIVFYNKKYIGGFIQTEKFIKTIIDF